MMTKKFLCKITFPALIFGSLLFVPDMKDFNFSSVALAETKMYTGTGESQMSEIETADIVKLRAREKAIQNATKQAGVVLLSYSRSVNSELTEDEISAITSTKYEMVGEPSYESIIKKITDMTTAIIWKATVNVNVDDSEIQNWLNLNAAEKAALIAQTKSHNVSFAENDKKAEDLRQQYLDAKTDADKARIKAELEKTDRDFLEILAVKKFRQGRYLSTSDEYAAEVAYTEAIELVPDYALAYFHRGKLYFHDLNDKRRALEDFTKVIELQPRNAEAYLTRGNVYGSLEDYKEDFKYSKLAPAEYDKAIEIDPNYAEAYSSRGGRHSLLKEHEKAIEDYTKAIQLTPKEDYYFIDRYYVQRGEAYVKLKDYNRAIKDFTSVIKLIPTKPAHYQKRAECYVNLGEYKKAVEDYTTAIDIKPDFSGNYHSRGEVYFLMKDYNRALEDFSKAIKLDPNDKYYYKDRAKVYEALGRHEEAQADLGKTDKNWYYDESQSDEAEESQYSIDELTQKINSNPNNADAYFNRGSAYRKSDDYEKALADFNKAIEFNPKNSVAYNGRGLTYYKMKNYESAMEDYNPAIKLNPKYADAYCNRGLVWHKLKEYQKAVKDYTKAIEINPAKKKYYKCRANSYLRLNEMDKYGEDLGVVGKLK